jgi:hypothetical protein
MGATAADLELQERLEASWRWGTFNREIPIGAGITTWTPVPPAASRGGRYGGDVITKDDLGTNRPGEICQIGGEVYQ